MSHVPTARELFISRRRLSAEDERSFFNSLRLRNRTFKTTTVGRLDDLNHLLLPLLPAARPLKTMDVAVSSGVTTVEWSRALTAAGITHRMMASDLMLSTFLISLGRYVHVLVDKTGYPLQFDFWGRAVPNPVIRRRDRLYRPLIVYVESQLGRHFASLARNCERAPEDEGVREGRLACRHITLVSPSVGKPAHIEFVEDDIQQNEGPRGCFHVVRAANILNKGYFSDQALLGMIANLRARLQAGGLLAVCRTTNDGINLATVFRLVETGRLDIVARLGAGSEVESLALSLPPL